MRTSVCPFDALSWDVKVRLVGDRDTRASRWSPLLIGVLGDKVEFLARIQGLPVPVADVAPLRDAANDLLGKELKAATDTIQSSLQISVKSAGVHLTNADGKNKYSFGMMLDKGFRGLDLIVNTAYSVADSSNAVTGTYSAKDLQLAAGLTGSVWKGLLEADAPWSSR